MGLSGERKRFACGLSRPRDSELRRRWHLVVPTSDRVGEAPKPAR